MKCCNIVKQAWKSERLEIPITLPRYITVGIVGVIIGMTVIWSFTEFLGMFYLVAGILSGILSILSDFIFHEVWTFSHRRGQPLFSAGSLQRFGKFLTHKVIGFVVAVAILAFLTQVAGLHYLVSNILAIAGSFTWNYILSSLWVWRKHT
ncbi:GtrA family protein [Chloroflexota bacterium]